MDGTYRVWISWILFFTSSIFLPTDVEQYAQRYSYRSPSGKTSRSRFRTGTAALHFGQKRLDASSSSNCPSPPGVAGSCIRWYGFLPGLDLSMISSSSLLRLGLYHT